MLWLPDELAPVLKYYDAQRCKVLTDVTMLEEQYFLNPIEGVPRDIGDDFFKHVQDFRGSTDHNLIEIMKAEQRMTLEEKRLFVKKYFNQPTALELLACDMMTGNSWSNVDFVWLSKQLQLKLTKPTIKTINVRTASITDIQRMIEEFNAVIEISKRKFNSDCVQFYLVHSTVSASDYDKMKEDRDAGRRIRLPIDQGTKGEPCLVVPTKLILSCGGTDMFIFELGFYEEDAVANTPPSKLYLDAETTLPEELIEFWNGLPLLYGHDEASKYVLQLFLREIYGVELKITTFRLSNLAVAAGCTLRTPDESLVSAIVSGVPMITGLEWANRHLARSVSDMRGCVVTYIAIQMQANYLQYVVLMATLMRNIFPDCSVVLTVTQMNQDSFTRWFTHVVSTAMLDTNVVVWEGHHTRAEMIRGLNRDSSRLGQIADLMMNVPVPGHGGCRYLHHARHCFEKQYATLKSIKAENFNGTVPNFGNVTKPDEWELLYNRHYREDDSWKPVMGRGLRASPQFADTIFELNVDGEICQFEQQFGRDLIPSLEEWARLFPYHAKNLMGKLLMKPEGQLYHFWMRKPRAYLKVKNVLSHVLQAEFAVPVIEEDMQKHRNNAIEHQRRIQANRSGRYPSHVVEDDRRRETLMEHRVYSEPMNVDLQGNAYRSIPSSYTDRNRQMRARAARDGKRKAHPVGDLRQILSGRRQEEGSGSRSRSGPRVHFDLRTKLNRRRH